MGFRAVAKNGRTMKAGPGILIVGFLLVLSLYSLGSEKSSGAPRFTLKISGGVNYLEVGDFNVNQKTQNEARREYTKRKGYGLSGEYELLHFGVDVEVEACMYLTRRLAIVLDTGYIGARTDPKTSRMTVDWTPYKLTSVFSDDTRIRAIPILLGLKYDILLGEKIGIFFKGCAGYNFVDYSRISREDQSGADRNYDWYTYREDGRSQGFGFQGGLGFIYKVNRRLSLVIEGCGRSLKIDGFKVDHKDEYSYGLSRSGSGTLYFLEYFDLDSNKWYPMVTVRKDPISSPQTERNLREAAVDFSGWALRAGIRISI